MSEQIGKLSRSVQEDWTREMGSYVRENAKGKDGQAKSWMYKDRVGC
jgi:hypothetical protein